MKIIHKLLTVFLISLIGLSAHAQDKKVEFGIAAGYGYTMPRLKDSRSIKVPTINSLNFNGFHVGPMLKLNINENFAIQTGALYNRFGGVSISTAQKTLKDKFGTWKQENNSLSALDIPLRVRYSASLADELSFFVFGGPNINYALSKVNSQESYVDKKLTTKVAGENIYKSGTDYNALDLQLGVGLGIQWTKISLSGSYDWGVLNRTNFENASLRSNDIKLSLSYTF